MGLKRKKRRELYEIEDDLSVEEAIYLIEWGVDADDIKSKKNSNKKGIETQ